MKRPADVETQPDGASSGAKVIRQQKEGEQQPLPDMTTTLDVAVRAVTYASSIARAVQARRRCSSSGGSTSNADAGAAAAGASGHLTKTDTSPVTVADYAVQCLITEYLAGATRAGEALRLVAEEDAELLGEEGGQAEVEEVAALLNEHFPFQELAAITGSTRQRFAGADVVALLRRGRDPGGREGSFWVLDPIDGTKGFIRDMQYAIGLGFVSGGEVVLGAMASPNLPALGGDVTRRADDASGGGGWVFAGSGPWAGAMGLAACGEALRGPGGGALGVDWRRRFEVLRAGPPPGALEAGVMCESFEAGHRGGDEIRPRSARLRAMADLRLDSMSKYALVARGDAHLYLRGGLATTRSEHIWDHCAGVPIIVGAGGKVTDLFGRPLDFGCGRLLSENKGILATNGSLHDEVLSEIERVRAESH